MAPSFVRQVTQKDGGSGGVVGALGLSRFHSEIKISSFEFNWQRFKLRPLVQNSQGNFFGGKNKTRFSAGRCLTLPRAAKLTRYSQCVSKTESIAVKR